MIDVRKLLTILNVPFYTEGKNCIPGRVSVQCPFCDDRSNHGSFGPKGDYRCWRCKGGTGFKALRLLTNADPDKINRTIQDCSTGDISPAYVEKREFAKSITVPGGDLFPKHLEYLTKRGFDPQRLVDLYGIKGTGFGAKWEGIDFSLRIIIPINDLDGRTISFQGRDITNAQDLRYKVCPIEKSLQHYKTVVYGGDLARNLNHIVVVEGIFDAWKLGRGAVATFGTGMTKEQILCLSNWQNVTFFFDPEPMAQSHAQEYARELASLGVNVRVAYEDFGDDGKGGKRDVGDLAPHEIARVRSELGI